MSTRSLSRASRASRACSCRPLACAVVVAVALGAHGLAYAADAHAQQELEQSEQALANLDYDAANKGAAHVAQMHGLTHEQLVRAYRVLATTYAVLDKEAASRDAFQLLLTYDPTYQGDPNLGPKVQAPFLEARGFMRAQPSQPGIDVAVVLRPSEPGTIRVTTRDSTHVGKRAAVSYRWGGEGTFTTVAVPLSEGATADIPAPPQGTTRLDYYAQVLDERDDAVFESGNALLPKSAMVNMSTASSVGAGSSRPAEQEHHSVFASPWFWTITGVVLAGAATTIYFATKSSDKNTTIQGTEAPPTSANLTPTLLCGTTRCN